MIFNQPMECMSRDEAHHLQSGRLQKLVAYLHARSLVYRAKMDKVGVAPADIRGVEDLALLPFTTKDDLRDHYPFGLYCVPHSEIREVHVSSGTTGNPTVVGYTQADLDLWGEVVARCLYCAGARPGDMVQVAYGYGLFTGGLGLHYGTLKAGLTALPSSSGQTKRQLKLMSDFKPRVLACTPSYALFMLDDARAMGLDPRESSWEVGVFGAEPWSDSMRAEIESTWNMRATDIYGLSEIIGPGVAQECEHKSGLHVFHDVFLPEVLDPNTGQAVPEGQWGELVFTTLTKQGMPLIRYRTRDITKITYATCACGRTCPRVSKFHGRTDDMLIIRGINVFPSQIEHVLLQIEGVQPHYQIIVDRKANWLDDLEVHVEVDEKIFSDEIKVMQALEAKIRREMEAVLGIAAKVKLVEPKTLKRSEGKAQRVIDKRQL